MRSAPQSARLPAWLALLLLMAVGLALRLPGLGQPLWGDEIASWGYARVQPLSAMIESALDDPTPPLYYVLLHASMPILGDGPVALRLPSVFFGVLLLPAIYWSMRQADFSQADALAAMALAASSSMLIYYAQEARTYALLACVATIATGLFFRCLRWGRGRDLTLYAGALVLLGLMHRYSLFLFASYALCALRYRQRQLVLITLAVGSLFVTLALLQINQGTFNLGAAGVPADLAALVSLVNSLSTGTIGMQTIQKMPHAALLRFPNPLVDRILPLLGLIVIGAVVIAGLRSRATLEHSQRCSMLALCVCCAVPIAAALLIGSPLLPRPQWLLRGLLFVWPLFFMAVAGALRGAHYRRWALVAIIALNLACLYPYYAVYTRAAPTAVFGQLHTATTSNDLVAISNAQVYDLLYFYRGPAHLATYDPREGWQTVVLLPESGSFRYQPLDHPQTFKGRVYVLPDLLPAARQRFDPARLAVYDPQRDTWHPAQATFEKRGGPGRVHPA